MMCRYGVGNVGNLLSDVCVYHLHIPKSINLPYDLINIHHRISIVLALLIGFSCHKTASLKKVIPSKTKLEFPHKICKSSPTLQFTRQLIFHSIHTTKSCLN